MTGIMGERGGGDVQQKGHRLELNLELQRSQESLMSNNTQQYLQYIKRVRIQQKIFRKKHHR